MRTLHAIATATAMFSLLLLAAGCPRPNGTGDAAGSMEDEPVLQPVHYHDPLKSVAVEPPIVLSAAGNETVSFAVELRLGRDADRRGRYALRIDPPARQGEAIAAARFTAAQVLPMPIDVNRASFVRYTGLPAAARNLPRALLPLPMRDGRVDLSSLRDPARPFEAAAAARLSAPATVWFDIHVPAGTRAGEYLGACQIVRNDNVVASVPIRLAVHDFDLPVQRGLQMLGQLQWQALVRLYPQAFEAVTPQLLSRRESRYAPAVAVLDNLVRLAHAHRVQVVIPRLQPIVKWPFGQPPQVTWDEFDSVVAPWLEASANPDGASVGFWPLPAIDQLERYSLSAQMEYWIAAARHFEQRGWLSRSAAMLTAAQGETDEAAAVRLCGEAARLLSAHDGLRVSIPVDEQLVRVAVEGEKDALPPAMLSRLMYTAPGLVTGPPTQRLPAGTRWLQTDQPGLVPFVGTGADELEVRLWAWLAFLRGAELIRHGSALPRASRPDTPADPDELVWFYPGHWFGLPEAVPTMPLKWLRRAQQDYEYLRIARQRGQVTHALVLARLLTKPVELQMDQVPNPVYAMMSGTTDPAAWRDALSLLATGIMLRRPGASVDRAREAELGLRTMQWIAPQERPLLLGHGVQWAAAADQGEGRPMAHLQFGIDVYNAADQRPDRNSVQWTQVPDAWQVSPRPVEVPMLRTYHVHRVVLDGDVDLDRVSAASRRPAELTFINGFTRRPTLLRVLLPVAASDQREGVAPVVDGLLDEWSAADALHDGRLVKMLNRPAVQRQELQFAQTESAVYSSWTGSNLYVAFRVAGLDDRPSAVQKSFVDYQFRRAWGEDLCEMLAQGLFADGSAGAVVHIVVKPRGQLQVSRRVGEPWQPVQGTDMRYVASVKEGVWRGEAAIPWQVFADASRPDQRPRMLRFNFSQHRSATGESASWAGPVDFGRDQQFTGLLYLRDSRGGPAIPGRPVARPPAPEATSPATGQE